MAGILEPEEGDAGRYSLLGIPDISNPALVAGTPAVPPVDPIWPTSNAPGTEKFVDYRGWDKPGPKGWMDLHKKQPDAVDTAVREALAPAPDTTYGSVLPLARDDKTGDLRLALPSSVRSFLQGGVDLTQGPRTGEVTPEATQTMIDTINPLARAVPGVLGAHVLSGGWRAATAEARAAATQGRTLLGDVIARTEGAVPEAPAGLLGKVVDASAPAADPLANTPMIKGVVSDGVRDGEQVSTRIPTAATPRATKANPNPVAPPDPHTTNGYRIGIGPMRAAADAYEKNAGYLRDGPFPDLQVNNMVDPGDITTQAVKQMKENLIWLHNDMRDNWGQDVVDRAKNWYDGAHQIVMNLAERSGYSPRQIATVMANLSPQKDWYQNADLGDRLTEVVKYGKDLQFTPEMHAWTQKYAAEKAAEIEKNLAKGKYDLAEKQRSRLEEFQSTVGGSKGFQGGLGPTFGETTSRQERAIFLRAYDEAHNGRSYPIVTPEGDFVHDMTDKNGETQDIGWGSFNEIGKAIEALDSDDPAHLSRLLGGNHKVRSFYNNMISPNSLHDDVTIDTHAINAAHLRPMGGSHPTVDFGLGGGGANSASQGTKGGYGIYHEAYRQAAEELGMLPRQLQSITWEGVRGMFTPEQKRDDALVADIDAIWSRVRSGEITSQDAREQIAKRAKGMNAPSWHFGKRLRPPPGSEEEPQQ